MIPPRLWPHVSIEEINSLTEDEVDILLYICNILYPIRPPTPSETNPHPITLNLIRCAQKQSVISRVMQACSAVTEEGKPIYNGLRTKLGIPNPPEPTPEPIKEEPKQILIGPPSGSVVQ